MSAAVEFFSAVFAPGDVLLIRPVETWTEAGRKRSRVDYDGIRYERLGLRDTTGGWVEYPEQLAEAVRRAGCRAEEERTNLFFGVCPRLGPDGSWEKAWQIRTVRVLWSDIDDAQPQEAVGRARPSGLPDPSIVVASGRGVHLYWLLAEPYVIDDAGDPPPVHTLWTDGAGGRKAHEYILDPATRERLPMDARQNIPPLSAKAEYLQDLLVGIAGKVGGDHVQDLARLLRIPGTMNRKDQRNGKAPVPCELVELAAGRRYPIGDFASLAAESPARRRRQQVAQVRLPQRPKVTKRQTDRLHDLVNACAVADVGARSEADFALCCYTVEQGLPRDQVWSEIAGVGKFAEAGERYFALTMAAAEQHTRERLWEAARGKQEKKAEREEEEEELEPIANAVTEYDGDQPTTRPLEMTEVVGRIFARTDNWPRRVGETLFIHTAGGVWWLKNQPDLFGWLAREHGVIDWKRSPGCVSKEETFCEVTRTAVNYAAIEYLPHEPRIPDHYYACEMPKPGNGAKITELVDRFAPASEEDRQLILAMFATVFWGGKGGSRPAFVVISEAGRGSGKSKLTDMVSHLAGGNIEISRHEDPAIIRQRLLSPDGLKKRIARLDNVKSLKFSWADMESLITAPTISGKRMYVGEGSRPNTLTWLITLNGISLSTDMAQRSVIIKLDRPHPSPSWEADTMAFIDANRQDLIADLIGFLQLEPERLQRHTRWAAWESDVVSKLPNPAAVQAVIAERAQGADFERDEIELIEKYFYGQIGLYYDPEDCLVHIPSPIAAEWMMAATNEKRSYVSACKILSQFCEEGRCTYLKANPSKKYGRGFLWGKKGGDADYDLEDRIRDPEKKLDARNERQSHF